MRKLVCFLIGIVLFIVGVVSIISVVYLISIYPNYLISIYTNKAGIAVVVLIVLAAGWDIGRILDNSGVLR